ncbi:MAG: bifunctional (p)ppGpp synthetase/guanosine-3',5'-bis(diphosphate) 3'-pyrophosphohydrolase [Acidimicrobiia bacterium]|nr:bifunctional (p)ppGpp synthetase/guanosine-3',5'-bis(diphosphate) 3'-pyrophosphohydrolase [Acidimicrobiia bacterium]
MVTVERVLPWRRKRRTIEAQVEPLIKRFDGARRETQIEVVTRAYQTAARAHQTQRRKSGEPYIVHPLAVARIIAELGLDEVSISAALLHDAVEDTRLELEDIDRAFGPDVAAIVDGVTKLDRIRFDSKEAQQAATMRKMMVAMSNDMRVLIIKLADRLHNLRTLAALPAWKQERIALESLQVYAPLAHRLGMQEIKMQMEDLSFAALHPKRYAEIEHMVAERAPERETYLTQVLEQVNDRVVELGIKATVVGREKHLYSIYEKMQLKGKTFDEINDLVGIRVIVETVRDCYAAMGSIHATWKPVQGRFKDYVAMPKFNLYQSLHTTVVGPQGKPIEVQIRTREMHDRAESGVAAHYVYKDANGDSTSVDLPWLTRIIDWEKETSDPDEFMKNLKVDLDHEEIFVFTPQGQVTTLPANSTPIDFAYAIHTDIGHRCVGAKVDGKLVSLSEPLHSGETVEIFTSKVVGAGPSRDWLNFVVSNRASSKIRQWFSRERRDDAIAAGEQDLKRALKKEGLRLSDFGQKAGETIIGVATEMNYTDADSLYAAIGERHVSAQSVATRLKRIKSGEPRDLRSNPPPGEYQSEMVPAKREPPGAVGVRIEGLDDVLVRLSRCCTPVPGDEIMGFVTRGRGVSIHRTDCANAESLASAQNDRLIDAEWDAAMEADHFVASLEVKAYDRSHLLADVSRAFSDQHVNIIGSTTTTTDDRIARLSFEFEIADPSHLTSLMRSLRGVDGVYDVYRIVPGGSRR